ncbi:MAG: hypothetical protein PF694_07955 [Bacteroidetes bacterium]|jgi:hypothetical protein|nr:hypothetical protein [Bacteroidota bacterium]
MKKSIYTIAIFLSIFSVVLTSCNKDDDTPPEETELKGSFQINIDGVLSENGTNADVGLIQETSGSYQNMVTIGPSGLAPTGIMVTGFPRTIGSTVDMKDSDPGITITSGQNYYSTTSGTITRTSASKISFTGKCKALLETQEYTITGFVESDAWKVIK